MYFGAGNSRKLLLPKPEGAGGKGIPGICWEPQLYPHRSCGCHLGMWWFCQQGESGENNFPPFLPSGSSLVPPTVWIQPEASVQGSQVEMSLSMALFFGTHFTRTPWIPGDPWSTGCLLGPDQGEGWGVDVEGQWSTASTGGKNLKSSASESAFMQYFL